MIWAFDWSSGMLIGPGVRISVSQLKELGWSFDEAWARKTLPRADRSALALPPR